MQYGMVRVGAYTPEIKVGNPDYNGKAIIELIKRAAELGVEIAVFPELCICGYTCADLFFTRELLKKTVKAVNAVAAAVPSDMVAVVGAPVEQNGRLYNCAVVMADGKILGIVPKTELPDYGEFYEKRYFTPAFDGVITSDDYGVPMGNVLFKCKDYSDLVLGCEICEDMWTDVPPSVQMCRAGATVIANLSASDEVVGKAEYRELLVKSISGRQHCAYVYADAGAGESSTDVVFSGHNIIAENGGIIDDSDPFDGDNAMADIDIERLIYDRRKIGVKPSDKHYELITFKLGDKMRGERICRQVYRYPFVPTDEFHYRAELIISMQAAGLKKRFAATKADALVLGVSGGLDSALALLVCNNAVGRDKITAVTMPCFGTTARTKSNAERLCAALGIKIKVIDIKDTVNSHLADIDHKKTDVVYENAQARVRTMTLFDLANKINGLVVGTGDMSELALGWCTYNGDHMSSYGVNAGVPKTLVKHLIAYEAERLGGEAKAVLTDILNTDISPELLPADKDGKIAQKTEDILGKYDLLDFIMYYYCRYGFTRKKIEFLLKTAFYDVADEQIQKALDTFFKRFFMSQFKRSCMPDGVKIGSVSFSPRSDFRLPSDIEN
ncbi:MAG: NAD(+) synthase [Clostridiales bacterium]|nr:NAD(+) synthase [Clostridiales bacterium]